MDVVHYLTLFNIFVRYNLLFMGPKELMPIKNLFFNMLMKIKCKSANFDCQPR